LKEKQNHALFGFDPMGEFYGDDLENPAGPGSIEIIERSQKFWKNSGKVTITFAAGPSRMFMEPPQLLPL